MERRSAILSGFRKRSIWKMLGLLVLLIVGCQSGTPEPEAASTPTAEPTTTEVALPSPTSTAATVDPDEVQTYRVLAQTTINGVGQLSRMLGGASITLTSGRADASEAQQIVGAARGSFELAREGLDSTEPPPGYEEVHEKLLEALSFYLNASSALLSDDGTPKVDYKSFQESMLKGGANIHDVSAALSELSRSGS